MDTPRILAVDDVHLAAARETIDDVVAFYADLIGLDRVDDGTSDEPVVFRGCARSGPKLVLSPGDRPGATRLRRQVLIQVASLTDCAQQMTELRTPFLWSHGWTFHDRRLAAFDPAGNRVELAAYHGF